MRVYETDCASSLDLIKRIFLVCDGLNRGHLPSIPHLLRFCAVVVNLSFYFCRVSLLGQAKTAETLVQFRDGRTLKRQDLLPSKELFASSTTGMSRKQRAEWLSAYIGEALAMELLEEVKTEVEARNKNSASAEANGLSLSTN